MGLSNSAELKRRVAEGKETGVYDFSMVQLREVPAQVFELPNVKKLVFFNNQITTIPVEVAQLTLLEELDFSYNHITEVPAEIGRLSNLRALHLHENSISRIPRELSQLSNLRTLNVDLDKLEDQVFREKLAGKNGVKEALMYLDTLV
eukprot:GILJ01002397.1.p1 GENE.GILJ01002397.1~~GILJ01002397.1.p1  ORF type:complete len:162 (+),score=26.72 GILJ01002397.1:45-488(+)